MLKKKKLPIGIEDFEKVITNDFYYVDKTMLIKELLLNWGEVNLFTRPRRFGKSLNISMLQSFFEIGCNKEIFNDLAISQERKLCQKYMGQFPVISITLKGIERLSFDEALAALRDVIGTEAMRFNFLLDSNKLTESEKDIYYGLVKMEDGIYTMSSELLMTSLQKLLPLLSKHYSCKTIIMIDEYDVPLDKAFQYGYYNKMVLFIRNVLGNALKSNIYLQFAILTGCLRISKESIFTGSTSCRRWHEENY